VPLISARTSSASVKSKPRVLSDEAKLTTPS
jgi:hypothetical protein